MLPFGLTFRRTFQHASWLALIFAPCLLWAQSQGIQGTMPEDFLPGLKALLETARRQSPTVLMQEVQIVIAEGRAMENNYRRYPNVGADIRYATNETATTGSAKSRDSGLFYSVSASQALFYWGEIKNTAAIQRLEIAMAQKNTAEIYRVVAVQIRKSFLDLIVLNARLRAERNDVAIREAALASMKQKLANGTLSGGEVAAAELDLSERQLHLERTQLEFDGARRQIGRLAGIGEVAANDVPATLPEPKHNAKLASELLGAMLRDQGKRSFKAQATEMRIQEADLNYRIARVRLLPKFSASMGHSRESTTFASATEVSQRAITRETLEVRGGWTIFDGFATKGAKLRSLSEKRQAERQLQIDTEAAMDEAQQLDRALMLDIRGNNLTQQRLANAQGTIGNAEQELKAGRISQIDVDAATNNLRFWEAQAIAARAQYFADWSAFVSRVTDDPALANLPQSYVRSSR